MVTDGERSADILVRKYLGGARFRIAQEAIALAIIFLLSFSTRESRSETLPEALARAQAAYASARSNYLAFPGETAAATALGKACFNLAELSPDNQQRAAIAQEGIAASKFASQMDPTNGAAFFYLALNQGDLARTKSLGALSLLRQMEKSLLRAAELDPHLEHAGPDRSLGELYRDAPGRPASIGNKTKAREHLERAVKLEPDYPDNHLSLMEGFLRWKETDALESAMDRYRQLVPAAHRKYSGSEWAQAWHDWNERWNTLQERASPD